MLISFNNLQQSFKEMAEAAYFPEVQHVEEDGDLHEVDPPADVVVPEHHQVAAQLQAGLLYQVGLPVAPEDLQEHRGL